MQSLVQVCVGRPRVHEWRGESVETGIFKLPVTGPVEVDLEGLEGDGQADRSVHGGVDKAVYAYDVSNLEFWRRELDRSDLTPGAFGENLTLSGVPDTEISIGDVFAIGTARFEVSQPRQPCFKLGLRMNDPRFPKRFLESARVGYYLRVLESGRIEAGDPIEWIERDPNGFRVSDLASLFTDRSASRESLERATSLPALADAWREPLLERLERTP